MTEPDGEIHATDRRVAKALQTDNENQANAIWTESEPTTETMEPEYVYLWVDPATNELTANSLNDAGDTVLQINFNVTTDDTGLIGGLL